MWPIGTYAFFTCFGNYEVCNRNLPCLDDSGEISVTERFLAQKFQLFPTDQQFAKSHACWHPKMMNFYLVRFLFEEIFTFNIELNWWVYWIFFGCLLRCFAVVSLQHRAEGPWSSLGYWDIVTPIHPGLKDVKNAHFQTSWTSSRATWWWHEMHMIKYANNLQTPIDLCRIVCPLRLRTLLQKSYCTIQPAPGTCTLSLQSVGNPDSLMAYRSFTCFWHHNSTKFSIWNLNQNLSITDCQSTLHHVELSFRAECWGHVSEPRSESPEATNTLTCEAASNNMRVMRVLTSW